jgi:hypothetical protein
MFLGDFWHVRGSLAVEQLNLVMDTLHEWRVPVIMIPGKCVTREIESLRINPARQP